LQREPVGDFVGHHANGQYGHQHSYHHFVSFPNVRSLPVLLTEAGYRTCRIGKYHVAPEEVYKFDATLPANTRSPVQMADNCRDFISSDDDKPFFLYFCTSDPHRGGGVANELPGKPDRFGNKPDGGAYPGVNEVKYDPGRERSQVRSERRGGPAVPAGPARVPRRAGAILPVGIPC